MMPSHTPKQIIEFWFSKESRSKWFASTPEYDQMLLDHFENIWKDAESGKLDDWLNTPEGCLALAIILDQLPLNMFRGTAKSFQTEAKAIKTSKVAIANSFQDKIPIEQRAFLYMPLMHSENIDDQDDVVNLFEKDGLDSNLRFAKHHRELIRKFGRFPHRNAILGRENTDSELIYLNSKEAFTG
ncbi:MAG: DUF924 family protein [Thiotrichaceae bacterium]